MWLTISGHRYRSVNFGGKTFLPENMCATIYKVPKFYMIIAPKNTFSWCFWGKGKCPPCSHLLCLCHWLTGTGRHQHFQTGQLSERETWKITSLLFGAAPTCNMTKHSFTSQHTPSTTHSQFTSQHTPSKTHSQFTSQHTVLSNLIQCMQQYSTKPQTLSISFITARAVATSCCISDEPCQWERANFDPHSSEISWPIVLKLKFK